MPGFNDTPAYAIVTNHGSFRYSTIARAVVDDLQIPKATPTVAYLRKVRIERSGATSIGQPTTSWGVAQLAFFASGRRSIGGWSASKMASSSSHRPGAR
jgi:hypothetical protein